MNTSNKNDGLPKGKKEPEHLRQREAAIPAPSSRSLSGEASKVCEDAGNLAFIKMFIFKFHSTSIKGQPLTSTSSNKTHGVLYTHSTSDMFS